MDLGGGSETGQRVGQQAQDVEQDDRPTDAAVEQEVGSDLVDAIRPLSDGVVGDS